MLKTKTTIDLPTIKLTDDPEYAAAWDRLLELQADYSTAKREWEAIAYTQDRKPRLMDRALALIAKRDIPSNAILDGERQNKQAKAYEHMETLRLAVQVQLQTVDSLRAAASKALIEQNGIVADYQQALREALASALVLSVKARFLEAFCERLASNQIEFTGSFSACPFRGAIGVPSDHNSLISIWMREVYRDHKLKEFASHD